ncbi:MAG TPA: T9SS type A sorting domain-containing protein, partial [Clostridiales bacterium]|nr:T9SS type A sorting domain-containing protein [Clostridiales bacterium]
DLTGELSYEAYGYYISDGQYIGGITGKNVSGILSLCSASGSIKGGMQLGGLTGQSAGVISNSYSTVNIFDETDYYSGTSYSESLGGLIGYNSGNVSDSYSAGHVEGRNYMTGGLIGFSSGTVSNCFWDTETSGRSTSSGGIGMTTAEMKTLSTFTDAGWDFYGETVNGTDDIWNIDGSNNDGYPFLSWQYDPSGIDHETRYSGFTLYQNYPNPFNPVTTISYTLPKASQVELNVYDLNGQFVRSLVNSRLDKGSYSSEFNVGDLTSGMYFYDLKVDRKSVQSRKMMLIK